MAEGVSMPEISDGMNKKIPGSADPPNGAKGEKEEKNARRRDSYKAKQDEKRILETARKRFKKCVESETENRAKALEDLKFKAGDQWPADVAGQRKADKRPCLTINKIPTLTHQVTNDLRQNRPAIHISPMGMKADKEGAQLLAGMINAIERDCAADIAYDTAITSAADIGFGYWRILTEYESPNTFDQVLVIKRVRNPFTVYLDPSRQEPDGCDARYGFVTEMVSREEFKENYPEANPYPWTERGPGDEFKEWITKDEIRIAEYFTIEHEFKRLVQLSSGHVGFYDDLAPEIKGQIESGEVDILAERQAESQKVLWHKITAQEVLETREWPGKWIPIIEVIGEEIDINGKVIRSGLIRNAKDAQRMKNYWATMKAELIALAPKAPFIMAEGQDEGYEDEWKQANVKSLPKLTYVPKTIDGSPVPPPQRQQPVGVPAGVVQAEQGAEQDLMATTGVRFDSSSSERAYDESGKAIRELRRNNDVGAFHYMDNASRSLRHTGRQLVDLIPKVYDTRRIVTILREDDTEERVTLDPTSQAPVARQNGAQAEAARKIFNPTLGQYGVTVTIGPSYATKRIEAHDQMMKFAAAMPEKGALIAHLIAKYSDWPGSDEIYKVLVKTLPPNLLTPDMRDLPPQIQTFVQGLQQQVGRLMAERMQMLKDLTDKKTDQALRKQEIDQSFEAKVMKIIADLKAKMMKFDQEAIQQTVSMAQTFGVGSMPSAQELVSQPLSMDAVRPVQTMVQAGNGLQPVMQPGMGG